MLYVAAGPRHASHVGGEEHALEPDTGAFLVPGDRFAIENPGPDDLVARLRDGAVRRRRSARR